MVDLAEIQAAYYMVAATGVLVAAIYYIINLRHNMKAREMEICRLFTTDFVSDQGMQKYAIMMTMEWKDYEDFMEKYGEDSDYLRFLSGAPRRLLATRQAAQAIRGGHSQPATQIPSQVPPGPR